MASLSVGAVAVEAITRPPDVTSSLAERVVPAWKRATSNGTD